MTFKSIPRVRVDFNELVGPNLVLLAKFDLVKCEDGGELLLQPGLPVVAFEYNEYADGATEYLYAQGLAERSDPTVNGEWTRNARWCCRFTGGVKVSESPI
jgi:hypothetical protein